MAVHHLRTFGCIVYVKSTISHLKKLEDRGQKMIFISYECGTKVCRAYDPIIKRVHVTRDVVFNEACQWDWSNDSEHDGAVGVGNDIFTIKYMAGPVRGEEEDDHLVFPSPATPAAAFSLPPHGTPTTPDATTSSPTPPGIQFASPPAEVGDKLDADHGDNNPLRFRIVENIIGLTSPPGYAVRDLGGEHLLEVSTEEPASLVDAKRQTCWHKAMEEELQPI